MIELADMTNAIYRAGGTMDETHGDLLSWVEAHDISPSSLGAAFDMNLEAFGFEPDDNLKWLLLSMFMMGWEIAAYENTKSLLPLLEEEI